MLSRRLNINNQIGGLVITNVDRNSPYFDRLAPSMVILEINRQSVSDLDSARQLLKPGRNLFFVYNRGFLRYLVVTKDSR